MPPNVFSVDVEDWFHILDTDTAPSSDDWTAMENRVELNTDTLLDLLQKHDTAATFFVLGWIAERYPDLVRRIAEAGHEVASHGNIHELVYEQTPEQFRQDLRMASERIENACGIRPVGYRAPGFSITAETPWAMQILAEEGYQYDSSIFPARRGHGGLPGSDPLPSKLPDGLMEFPISTRSLGPGRVAYLGGGYLRLLPQWLISRWAALDQQQEHPLILYIHPRDIDVGQPRLQLGPWRRFKSYVGLASCLNKLDRLLERFKWTSFQRALEK